MDRRQMVVQRARDFFGERLDDIVHMVRQDRQEMRGWEEPAHVRAVVRRTIREGATSEPGTSETAVAQVELGRGAGEPDKGQQREGLGQLLEAGATALEKITRSQSPELTPEEVLSLEAVLLLYGRPAILVSQGRLASVPPLWNVLEDQREDIEMAQRGVGRIELLGHPEYDWAGTGFLVSENALLTTKRVAEGFIEERSGQWQFRPGMSAWMDYRSQYQRVATAGYRVRGVIGVHPTYDLALLEVEPPQQQLAEAPTPIILAAEPPLRLEGRPVYLIGYPVRDARRNEPELIARVFRDVYNVKRVQPGVIRGRLQFHEVQLLQHDCAPLGQSAGSCLVDLETHQVLGLQLSGRYLESSTAIPLWVLRDDPLLRRAGVTFTQATPEDQQRVVERLERLARSRYWTDARTAIGDLYRRAFGNTEPK
ncbi:MAG: serine protease [Gemmataceae bacterium]|nr:serine protease [Gemmataceae bacterium]